MPQGGIGNLQQLKEGRAMRRVVLALGIVFTTAGPLLAQVHIQEKVVITPAQPKTVQGGSNNHTIRFEFDWDEASKGMVGCAAGCGYGQTVEGSGSSVVMTISSAPVQEYDFEAYAFEDYNVEMVLVHYSWWIFVDDSLVENESGSTWLWGVAYNGNREWATCAAIRFFTPYYSTFDFSLGIHQFAWGDSTGMSMSGDFTGDCSNTAWVPTDPVTLTIVSGAQYASFHRTDPQTGAETKLGSDVTTTGDRIGEYSLVADGINPASDGGWVTVQAESDGMTKTDSVQILPTLDHFYVYTDPDTIEHSDGASIYVQGKTADDQDVDYDGDIQISAAPPGYGELGTEAPASKTKRGGTVDDVRH